MNAFIKYINANAGVPSLFCIPKLLENAHSEFRPDARSRRNMMRMVFPFQVLQRSASFRANLPKGKAINDALRC